MAKRWITWRGKHILVDDDGDIIDKNDENYFYHYTSSSNINNIKKEGLKPYSEIDNETKGLFLSELTNNEQNKVFGDIELRIKKDKIKEVNKYLGNYYTKNIINSEDIEIKNKKTNKWEKLK